MEGQMENLAEVYVQHFELDHFGAPVKREPQLNLLDEDEMQNSVRLRQINLPDGWQQQQEERRIHILSPQTESHTHQPLANGQGIFVNGVNGLPMMPPESSPHVDSPCYGPMYNNHANSYSHSHRQSSTIIEDEIWLPQTMRGEQSLDLRPLQNCSENDWDRRDYMQQQQQVQSMINLPSYPTHLDHHHESINVHNSYNHAHGNRPISVSSTQSSSTISPRQPGCNSLSGSHNSAAIHIADELLLTLSVRELNKRLHGCSRNEIAELKRKRRTLKTRDYAHIYRLKKRNQREEFDKTIRNLLVKLKSTRVDLKQARHEIDILKQRLS